MMASRTELFSIILFSCIGYILILRLFIKCQFSRRLQDFIITTNLNDKKYLIFLKSIRIYT